MKLTFSQHLKDLLLSGTQAIFTPTKEEARFEKEVFGVTELLTKATGTKHEFVTWDAQRGFSAIPKDKKDIRDPVLAIESLLGATIVNNTAFSNYWGRTCGLFVFRGLHDFFKDAVVRQCIRNMVVNNNLNCPDIAGQNEEAIDGYRRVLIVLAPNKDIHKDIEHCFTLLPFKPPTLEQLAVIFDSTASNVVTAEGTRVSCPDDIREKSISALRGLREREAEDIMSFACRTSKGFNEALVEAIEDQKGLTLQKSDVLHYISKDKILAEDELAGNDILMTWMKRKAMAFGPLAEELKLDAPRGVVLIGPPGTGKSTIAKLIARILSQALIRFNVSRLGGSLIGESQQRTEEALNQIDAFDGSVVWIDEAEKVVGGVMDRAGDGGTKKETFGMLNNWLTEHTSRSFVVLTMNRIAGVPEEFLRKGRFDEIFFVDLPPAWMRRDILNVHLKKRGVDPYQYKEDLAYVIEHTADFSGAELEQVVIDAREEAALARRSGIPTLNELIEQAKRIKPLARTRADEIEQMKRIAEENGQYASTPDEQYNAGSQKASRRVLVG